MQNQHAKDRREKPCDCCSKLVATRYRIQLDSAQQWRLVCKSCQLQQAKDNPYYRYGGTWKAKKRRH